MKKQEQKLSQILDAARQRFGTYGLAKTTMNEIAADIGLSKASLYYYFKDKDALFRKVVEDEQHHFLDEMNKMVKSDKPASVQLREFVELRIGLIRKLFTLGKFTTPMLSEVKPMMKKLVEDFYLRELKLVREILRKGIRNKEFKIPDASVYDELFLVGLRGLRLAAVSAKDGHTILLSARELKTLKEKSKRYADVFIRGISA